MQKTLAQLAALVKGAKLIGNKELTISSIEHDSRKVTKGTLFVCIEGVHVDGHRFIPQAIGKGAAAVLTEKDIPVPAEGMAVLQVPSLRGALDTIMP